MPSVVRSSAEALGFASLEISEPAMLSPRNPTVRTTTATEPTIAYLLTIVRASLAVFSAYSAFALLPAMVMSVPSLGVLPILEARFAERAVDSS